MQSSDGLLWCTGFKSPAFDATIDARRVDGELRDIGPSRLSFSPTLARAELMYTLSWSGNYQLEITFPEDSTVKGWNFKYDSGEKPMDQIADDECALMLSFTDEFMAEQQIAI